MDANLTRRQVGTVTVLDITGRVTLGEGSALIREEIKQLAVSGFKNVVVNLGGITYIDSSGIGELVSGVTTMGHAGGSLRLLKPGQRVKDLLKMTRLDTVFQAFEEEGEAVRSFS
ncbi:MAG: STAS domain-containing protein [Acidobacteria bacterium]|nr:STAS domain-containing protein [Acidobacteriota bacterium]